MRSPASDLDGKVFGEELARIGWVGDEKVGARKMHAMLELHIEQGPILEAERQEIGVVTHGQGLWWLEITLTGKDAHTGSTPMNMRVNAGLGMARITERVHQIAMSHQPNAVGAVGQVKVFPNSRNVIPGKVVFTVDIRSPEQAKLDAMKAEVIRAAHAVAKELGLGCEIEDVGPLRPRHLRPRPCEDRPASRRKAGLFPHGHRLRRRPRRLLDQPRRPHGDGDVPLRGRAQPQRGRRDHAGMGGYAHSMSGTMCWASMERCLNRDSRMRKGWTWLRRFTCRITGRFIRDSANFDAPAPPCIRIRDI
jgi:hypothetical protein